MRIISAIVVLFALWLLLSGIYKPMVIGFGAISALIAVWVVERMNAQDGDPVSISLNPLRFIGYIIWLFGEIAKANWAVTKVVMAPTMPIRQHMFDVRHSQKTDVGQVIFANSITLTPGTITIETEETRFLVHALSYTHETIGELGKMDDRVTAAEGGK